MFSKVPSRSWPRSLRLGTGTLRSRLGSASCWQFEKPRALYWYTPEICLCGKSPLAEEITSRFRSFETEAFVSCFCSCFWMRLLIWKAEFCEKSFFGLSSSSSIFAFMFKGIRSEGFRLLPSASDPACWACSEQISACSFGFWP